MDFIGQELDPECFYKSFWIDLKILIIDRLPLRPKSLNQLRLKSLNRLRSKSLNWLKPKSLNVETFLGETWSLNRLRPKSLNRLRPKRLYGKSET